jgi:hypothetical protein
VVDFQALKLDQALSAYFGNPQAYTAPGMGQYESLPTKLSNIEAVELAFCLLRK